MNNPEAEEVRLYKERFNKEAEELLLVGFPATILQLNTLMEAPEFKKRDFSDMHANSSSLPASALHLERGDHQNVNSAGQRSLKPNQCVLDLIETVKPYILKLMEDAKVMRMWITYMTPKVEGGNNFGVQVQEDILDLVYLAECSSARFYGRISSYLMARAVAIKDSLKHPEVEDYRRYVQEFDEKEYVSFCLAMADIRNRYCSMHDAFSKNLEKLKTPRPPHGMESMY